MLGITDCKKGAKIKYNGEPYLVVWNQFSKSARQGGVMKTKMKNILTGKVMEKTFQGSDKIDEADLAYKNAQFLYANGDDYSFMDMESYETIVLQKGSLGDTINFLTDGMDCSLLLFEGNPVNVQVPAKMEFTIAQTDPGVQGDRSSAGTKPATLDTGYVIRVPLFIDTGDKVVVNTDLGEYVERVKK
jgi:elongation factor P